MWHLPGPGIEPVSPALAGGFLTMAPPGKSSTRVFVMRKLFRRRKQEASGLLGASRAGKAFALSILQFEIPEFNCMFAF